MDNHFILPGKCSPFNPYAKDTLLPKNGSVVCTLSFHKKKKQITQNGQNEMHPKMAIALNLIWIVLK